MRPAFHASPILDALPRRKGYNANLSSAVYTDPPAPGSLKYKENHSARNRPQSCPGNSATRRRNSRKSVPGPTRASVKCGV